jgi:hypothetical protein
METRLRKLNTSQLKEICRKMKCSRGSKKEMIGNLLRPLRKYRMSNNHNDKNNNNNNNKVNFSSLSSDLKGNIQSFLQLKYSSKMPQLNRRNKLELQPNMDKRARKHMKKIRKWNKLLRNNTGEELNILEEDVGELFDLTRMGFLTPLPNFLSELRFYLSDQLKIAWKNEDTEILENILKDKDKIWRDTLDRILIQQVLNKLFKESVIVEENPKIYEILLKYGADPNQILDGQSLLDYFVMEGLDTIDDREKSKKIVNMMRKYGAQSLIVTSSDRNQKNLTDLMIDVKLQDKNAVEERLENGVDVNAKDLVGNTALIFAVFGDRGDDNLEIINLLIENGADVNITNNDGNTLLHELSYAPDLDIIKMLLKNGADINAINEKGESVLDLMIKNTYPNEPLITMLKGKGAKSAK